MVSSLRDGIRDFERSRLLEMLRVTKHEDSKNSSQIPYNPSPLMRIHEYVSLKSSVSIKRGLSIKILI
jgi:hypothetical protein